MLARLAGQSDGTLPLHRTTMPRFFIDLHDGSQHIRDKEGFEVPCVEGTQERVVGIMSAIAQNFESGVDHQHCVAAVRGEDGSILYRARLSLDFERSE